MSKKKWLLLILCILLLAGYWKFFYKTWSETVVAGNADCIVAIDVKRITNTMIWNTITTPSQWKNISFSSSEKFSWKDMISIPDYVFVFHVANQPAGTWYTILSIKDSSDFEKGLAYYHFEKIKNSLGTLQYCSKEWGVTLVKNGNRVLVGNAAIEDKALISQVADELFVQKKYINRKQLFKNIEASSHVSVQVAKNGLLAEDAIIMLNFDKKKIEIETALRLQQQFKCSEQSFNIPSNRLLTAGFTQPPIALYSLVSPMEKEKISRKINFNIDSLLLETNKYYQLTIAEIAPRIDSAISYSYDENFNKIEKVVINNVLEPSYNFTIYGDSIEHIYNYWDRSGQLENTDTGKLFLPMPFVRSWCIKRSAKELSVQSAGISNFPNGSNLNCIFFLELQASLIPAELWKYLPPAITTLFRNIESIKFDARYKEQDKISLKGVFNKKKNDLPIAGF